MNDSFFHTLRKEDKIKDFRGCFNIPKTMEQNAHVKEQNAHCTVTNYTFDSFFKIMVKQG